jgi:phage N-6-adenine-methyltransferase
MAILTGSKTVEDEKNRWGTTPMAFNDAQMVSGLHCILDACAEPATAKCNHFINPLQDALITNWSARFDKARLDRHPTRPNGIWCNPPFNQKKAFIQRAHQFSCADGIPVLMMLPYERQTVWWQKMIHGVAATVFVPDARYWFMLPDGKTERRDVNFGSCFILFDASYVAQTQYVDFSVRAIQQPVQVLDLIALEQAEQTNRRQRSVKRK